MSFDQRATAAGQLWATSCSNGCIRAGATLWAVGSSRPIEPCGPSPPRTSSLFPGILLTDEGGGVVSVEVRARDVVTTAYRHISYRSSGVI